MAEGEKPHHSSGTGNIRTASAFKAAFQELKKKSSAINLFSTTPTAGVPPPTLPTTACDIKPDVVGGSLEYSALESALSSKSHNSDLPSSELPRVSPSGLNLVDEVDKGSEHISLGE